MSIATRNIIKGFLNRGVYDYNTFISECGLIGKVPTKEEWDTYVHAHTTGEVVTTTMEKAPCTTCGKSRGLGDTVAKITSAFGIEPCEGCLERKRKLNELFPYKENI